MKRILAFIIATLICLSFCACGSENNTTNPDNQSAAPSATDVQPTENNEPQQTNAPDETPAAKTDTKEVLEYLTNAYAKVTSVNSINANGDCKVEIDGIMLGMSDSTYKIQMKQDVTAENGNMKLDEVLTNDLTDKASGSKSTTEDDTYYTCLKSSGRFYAHKKSYQDGILLDEQKYCANNTMSESTVPSTTLLSLSLINMNETVYQNATVEDTSDGGKKITVSINGNTNKEAANAIVIGEQFLFDILYESITVNVDVASVEMIFDKDNRMLSAHKVITAALKCDDASYKTDATLNYEMTTTFAYDNIETITEPENPESYEDYNNGKIMIR